LFSDLDQILAPYGYSEVEAGYLGIIQIVSGIIGSLIMGLITRLILSFVLTEQHLGIVIDHFGRNYKRMLLIGFIGTGVSLVFLYFMMKSNNLYPLGAACGLCGFFSISMLPLALETAVEITLVISNDQPIHKRSNTCTFRYPEPEATSAAVMIFTGNVFAVIFTVLVSVLQNANANPMLLFATSFLGVLFIIFLKPDYKRLHFEQQVQKGRDLVQ